VQVTDLSSSQSTQEDASPYEAMAEKLLADMKVIDAQMQGDRMDIDRLREETRRLKAETIRLETENRAALSRLKAAV
jgi:hypothetical protein